MSHTHIIILGLRRFKFFGRVLVYDEGGSFMLERERFMLEKGRFMMEEWRLVMVEGRFTMEE